MVLKSITGLAAALLVVAGTSAMAAETPTSAGECEALVETLEISIEEKGMTDNDAVNELMLALDKACSESDYTAAKDAADQVEAAVAG